MYILFEHLNMRAPMFAWVNVLNVVVVYIFVCIYLLTLTSVKFDSQSRTRWCLSTMILKMTVHSYTSMDEQASERMNGWTSERAKNDVWQITTTTTINELCSDERVNNPLNCIQYKRVFTVRIHTHTHAHTHKYFSREICQFSIRISLHARTWQTRASKQRNESARAHSLTCSLARSFHIPISYSHSPLGPLTLLLSSQEYSCFLYTHSFSRSFSCKKEILELVYSQNRTKQKHFTLIASCSYVYSAEASVCTCSLVSYS